MSADPIVTTELVIAAAMLARAARTLIPGLRSRSKAEARRHDRLTEIARDRNRVWRAEQINAARVARAEAHNHHEPPTKPNLTPMAEQEVV